MHNFNIEIANRVANVSVIHERSKAICRPYMTTHHPDFSIQTTESDIEHAREVYEKTFGPCSLWDGSLEVNALHRLLTEKLLDYNTLLLHGAAIEYEGNAFIFSAPSGTGKTTHIMKWLQEIPNTAVINGDKPFIEIPGSGMSPIAYGSPWNGKEGLGMNAHAPVRGIILMERAEENSIRKIPFEKAFPIILKQVYLPQKGKDMCRTIDLLNELGKSVDWWGFGFNNFKEDCVSTVFEAVVPSLLEKER